MKVYIEQQYIVCDRLTVLHFLEQHPRLVPVLRDLRALIPDYFPECPLFLRIVTTAPTPDAQDGRRLVLFIASDLGEEHSMGGMDDLMTAWRPDVRFRTGEPLSVDLAFGTTAADVELAAQRFVQRHGNGHSAHRALAQRLLSSKPGSEEEDLARAELAASLADDLGRPRSAGGGSARAVLARL